MVWWIYEPSKKERPIGSHSNTFVRRWASAAECNIGDSICIALQVDQSMQLRIVHEAGKGFYQSVEYSTIHLIILRCEIRPKINWSSEILYIDCYCNFGVLLVQWTTKRYDHLTLKSNNNLLRKITSIMVNGYKLDKVQAASDMSNTRPPRPRFCWDTLPWLSLLESFLPLLSTLKPILAPFGYLSHTSMLASCQFPIFTPLLLQPHIHIHV